MHLEGRCEGQLFDSRDVCFIVGEAQDKGVPLGVDRAMEKMQKGECCLLQLKSKYASSINMWPLIDFCYSIYFILTHAVLVAMPIRNTSRRKFDLKA